jgi:predicted transcriptional regulator
VLLLVRCQSDVFGDAPLRLERDARQELVAELAAEGMSPRAIAPILGVSRTAIRKDIEQVGTSAHVDHTMMRVNEVTGEVEDVPES